MHNGLLFSFKKERNLLRTTRMGPEHADMKINTVWSDAYKVPIIRVTELAADWRLLGDGVWCLRNTYIMF